MQCSGPHRFRISCLLVAAAGFLCACPSTSVDCDALCARTLACEVTFGPADDPDGAKVVSGERSDAESCALGCAESPTVNVDNAACVDQLEISSDPALCQDAVLRCLDLEEAAGENT